MWMEPAVAQVRVAHPGPERRHLPRGEHARGPGELGLELAEQRRRERLLLDAGEERPVPGERRLARRGRGEDRLDRGPQQDQHEDLGGQRQEARVAEQPELLRRDEPRRREQRQRQRHEHLRRGQERAHRQAAGAPPGRAASGAPRPTR